MYFHVALRKAVSLARLVKKSDSPSIEDCLVELHETMGKSSLSDDVCSDSTSDILDLVPNEDRESALKE